MCKGSALAVINFALLSFSLSFLLNVKIANNEENRYCLDLIILTGQDNSDESKKRVDETHEACTDDVTDVRQLKYR